MSNENLPIKSNIEIERTALEIPNSFKTYFFLILVIVGCTNSREENISSSRDSLEIIVENIGDSLLLNGDLSSVSLGVYSKKEKFTKHFGELDKNRGNKPTDSTIYEIGSVGKTFTGMLAAKAVLENKINIEDDVRKYLDGKFPNLEYEGFPIRIKHLLTHTSGFVSNFPDELNLLLQDFGTNDSIPILGTEILKKYDAHKFFDLLNKIRLDTIPGHIFSYSNENAELMGFILEKVYNQPFEELLYQNIFSVYDMNSSSLSVKGESIRNFANGYSNSDMQSVPHWVNKRWGASGNVKSSIQDLIRFLDCQLDTTNRAVKKSHEPLFSVNKDMSVCYFWFRVDDDDMGRYYYHHGGVWGMQNYLIFFPEYDLGISILTNRSNQETGNLLWSAVNQLFHRLKKTHNNM